MLTFIIYYISNYTPLLDYRIKIYLNNKILSFGIYAAIKVVRIAEEKENPLHLETSVTLRKLYAYISKIFDMVIWINPTFPLSFCTCINYVPNVTFYVSFERNKWTGVIIQCWHKGHNFILFDHTCV